MVQIYENPKGLAAAQVANQHNPEFAALNSITSSYADGPITAAMAQMEMDDKFGGLKGALKQKQLDRKWARGDKQWDWLNHLKFLQSQKGYDPATLSNLDTAFSSFARGNKTNPLQIPSYLGTIGQGDIPNFAQMQQTGGNAVPQFTQQDFINALTGYDLSDKLQNLSTLHTKYVENPNAVSQEEMDAALNDLDNARKLQQEKSRGIHAAQYLTEDGSVEVNNPMMTWLQSFVDKDIANRRFNQLPKWAQLRNNDQALTKTAGMAFSVADGQKFMNAVYKDLNAKHLTEVDPSVVKRLQVAGFKLDPYNQILVQDGKGDYMIYETSTGQLTPAF